MRLHCAHNLCHLADNILRQLGIQRVGSRLQRHHKNGILLTIKSKRIYR